MTPWDHESESRINSRTFLGQFVFVSGPYKMSSSLEIQTIHCSEQYILTCCSHSAARLPETRLLLGVLDGPEPGSQDPALCKGLLCIHRCLRIAKTMRNVWLRLKISFCVGVYNPDNDGPEVTPGQVHSNWLVSTLGLCNNWLV